MQKGILAIWSKGSAGFGDTAQKQAVKSHRIPEE